MAGNDTSIQHDDDEKVKGELNLSIGNDSNIKGLDSNSDKDSKTKYNRVKGNDNYATAQ